MGELLSVNDVGDGWDLLTEQLGSLSANIQGNSILSRDPNELQSMPVKNSSWGLRPAGS